MFEVKIDFQKLARRLRARDEDAYEFVIESYRRRIICYLLKKGVPYEEAKDIASDCISKLWETACEGTTLSCHYFGLGCVHSRLILPSTAGARMWVLNL
jgi:hypothetical protein